MPTEPGDNERRDRSRARDYAFATIATTVAIALTLFVTRWLEDFPLLLLLTAVMGSALRGGTGPGLVATTLSGLAILAATHFLADAFAIPRVNLSDEVTRFAIFVVVAIGISVIAGARRRAEAERDALLVRERAAREDAEAASLAKDRFLATVSHELRTPLSAIVSWASVLREAPGADEIARAVDAIVRNAKAQARLVDDLLDVSRIVAGKLRLELHPTRVAAIVAEAVDVLRPAADAKRLDLELDLDGPVDPIMADPDRLRQVVSNLVSNAVKFTPEGGRVWIRLRAVDAHVEIRVSDNGEGVPPELLPRLFEPFWQGGGPAEQRPGLGLGLAIVRHIVELHGGTVVAHSEGAGHGMFVRILLPSVPPTRKPASVIRLRGRADAAPSAVGEP